MAPHERKLIADKVGEFIYPVSLEPKRPVGQLVKDAFGRRTPRKAFRIIAGYHLASRPFENAGFDIETALTNRLTNTDHLPFAINRNQLDASLMGSGWESIVFQLGDDQSRVLKVDRESLLFPNKDRPRRLRERAATLHAEHQQIKKWYGDIEGFVVPSYFVIGNMPYRDKPAIGIVQPFIHEAKGFFEDFTNEQLLGLFSRDDKLKQNYIKAASKFFELLETSDKIIDIIGAKNLLLVPTAESYTLTLMDSSSLNDLGQARREGWSKHLERFAHRKQRLAYLLEKSQEQVA